MNFQGQSRRAYLSFGMEDGPHNNDGFSNDLSLIIRVNGAYISFLEIALDKTCFPIAK